MPKSGLLKAQAAMEYLMTYGWAILIIAIVMVAIFTITGNRTTTAPPVACLSFPGYLCQSPIYSHSGNLLVTIGQSTGQLWTAWALAFAPQGSSISSNGVPAVYFANVLQAGQPITSSQYAPLMPSGQSVPTNMLANTGLTVNNTVPVGTSLTGSIWICYTTALLPSGVTTLGADFGGCNKPAGFTGAIYYAQLATITAKAA